MKENDKRKYKQKICHRWCMNMWNTSQITMETVFNMLIPIECMVWRQTPSMQRKILKINAICLECNKNDEILLWRNYTLYTTLYTIAFYKRREKAKVLYFQAIQIEIKSHALIPCENDRKFNLAAFKWPHRNYGYRLKIWFKFVYINSTWKYDVHQANLYCFLNNAGLNTFLNQLFRVPRSWNFFFLLFLLQSNHG